MTTKNNELNKEIQNEKEVKEVKDIQTPLELNDSNIDKKMEELAEKENISFLKTLIKFKKTQFDFINTKMQKIATVRKMNGLNYINQVINNSNYKKIKNRNNRNNIINNNNILKRSSRSNYFSTDKLKIHNTENNINSNIKINSINLNTDGELKKVKHLIGDNSISSINSLEEKITDINGGSINKNVNSNYVNTDLSLSNNNKFQINNDNLIIERKHKSPDLFKHNINSRSINNYKNKKNNLDLNNKIYSLRYFDTKNANIDIGNMNNKQKNINEKNTIPRPVSENKLLNNSYREINDNVDIDNFSNNKNKKCITSRLSNYCTISNNTKNQNKNLKINIAKIKNYHNLINTNSCNSSKSNNLNNNNNLNKHLSNINYTNNDMSKSNSNVDSINNFNGLNKINNFGKRNISSINNVNNNKMHYYTQVKTIELNTGSGNKCANTNKGIIKSNNKIINNKDSKFNINYISNKNKTNQATNNYKVKNKYSESGNKNDKIVNNENNNSFHNNNNNNGNKIKAIMTNKKSSKNTKKIADKIATNTNIKQKPSNNKKYIIPNLNKKTKNLKLRLEMSPLKFIPNGKPENTYSNCNTENNCNNINNMSSVNPNPNKNKKIKKDNFSYNIMITDPNSNNKINFPNRNNRKINPERFLTVNLNNKDDNKV